MRKISVVTPVYNGASFIAEAIESLLNQTSPYWEHIIVDDGSNDDTAEVVSIYAKSDTRIRLIRQTNSGPAIARGTGVKHATGDFVTFLDADDILHKDAIEIFNRDISAYCNDITIYSHEEGWKYFPQTISTDDYIVAALKQEFSTGPCCKLFRKDLLNEFVFDIPPRIKVAEDWLINIRIAFNLDAYAKVRFSKDIVYTCRRTVNDKSLMKSFRPTKEYDDIFFNEFIHSIPDRGLDIYSNEIAGILLSAYHAKWRKVWYLPPEAKSSELYLLTKSFITQADYRCPLFANLELKTNNSFFRMLIDISERVIGVFNRCFIKKKFKYYEQI